MTTTRSKKSSDPREQMTLAQFSASLDAHAGKVLAFAARVELLAEIRAQRAVLTDHRKEVYAVVREAYQRGDRVAGGGVLLRETAPTAVHTERAVSADAAKKHSALLWEAAKVRTPHVQAAPPKALKSAIALAAHQAVGALPPVPAAGASCSDAVRAYQACPSVGALNDAEEIHVQWLREIGEQYGWDGLPIRFNDGWVVGLERMQYSSDRLKELAPGLWEQLAVERNTGGNQRVYLSNARGEGLLEE